MWIFDSFFTEIFHFFFENSQFEFPHFFQKLNHLQNKKAKTLH